MTDNGTTGKTDTLALTVWNKSGGLWFAGDWSGTQTVEQMLSGGNVLVVPSGVAPKAMAAAHVAQRHMVPLSLSITLELATLGNGQNPGIQISFPVVPGVDYILEHSNDLV